MGICLSFLPFLDACHEAGGFGPVVYGLGNVELHETEQVVDEFAASHGYTLLRKNRTVRALLKERYGVTEYADFDLNGKADVSIDLGVPLPREFVGRATGVINAGTLEAIFDQRQAFENMHLMVRGNGVLVHLAPITWYNHAFFNLDPQLFRALAKANGYELLTEAYHSKSPLFGERGKIGPTCYLSFSQGSATPYGAAFDQLHYETVHPAGLLYMVCYRKVRDAQFQVPYDVMGDLNKAAAVDTIQSAPKISPQNAPAMTVKEEGQEVVDTPCAAQSECLEDITPASSTDRKLSGSDLVWEMPMMEIQIPPHEIHPADGFSFYYPFRTNAAKFFARSLTGLEFSLYEDGKPLTFSNALHTDIATKGEGRVSIWKDQLLFSSSDNTDPRSNGRRYSFKIPSFVHFLEGMPPAGIRKFSL